MKTAYLSLLKKKPNTWYTIKDFLYTEVNICNCSLLIVFELRLKNPRQPDFSGAYSTPQSEVIRYEQWNHLVRSFLSRVQWGKTFLRWKGNDWHRWTSFDLIFWNANQEASLHDIVINSYSTVLDSLLEQNKLFWLNGKFGRRKWLSCLPFPSWYLELLL